MAYANRTNPADRGKALVATIAIEALAIYGIVAGLAMSGVIEPIAIFKARDIPAPRIDPVPPPPPRPHDPATKIDKTIVLPPAGPVDGLQTQTGTTIDTGPIATPTPIADPLPIKPAFTPTVPKARGTPGEWVTPNDYPAQDLREGNQGTVRFRLEVNAQGRVVNCTITSSSGFPRLDAAACARVSQRGRFDPATGENGAKVTGTWSSAVRWTIPRD